MGDNRLKVMTIDEAAAYLNLHKSTIYRLVNQKKIPAMKLGGQWRFKKDAIDSWVAQEIDKRMDKTMAKSSSGLDKLSEAIQNAIASASDADSHFAVLKFSFPEKTDDAAEAHKSLMKIIRKVVRTGRDTVITKGKEVFIILKDTAANGIISVKERIIQNIGSERSTLAKTTIQNAISVYPKNGNSIKDIQSYLKANAETFKF